MYGLAEFRIQFPQCYRTESDEHPAGLALVGGGGKAKLYRRPEVVRCFLHHQRPGRFSDLKTAPIYHEAHIDHRPSQEAKGFLR